MLSNLFIDVVYGNAGFLVNNEIDHGTHQADEQSCPERFPEAGDLETRHYSGSQIQKESIDNQGEKTQA